MLADVLARMRLYRPEVDVVKAQCCTHAGNLVHEI
jgi:hypothetical protein